jgi:hypothetical protein
MQPILFAGKRRNETRRSSVRGRKASRTNTYEVPSVSDVFMTNSYWLRWTKSVSIYDGQTHEHSVSRVR